mgnify:CR=1 FL=1
MNLNDILDRLFPAGHAVDVANSVITGQAQTAQGTVAVLGTTEKASELVREIPFAARTSVLVFDLKIVLLLGIFVYAFFRFTWSLRQYTFGALLVGALPERDDLLAMGDAAAPIREAFAERAGRVVGLAAETFNDGLRAYYMAFAAVAWFVSPWAFMAATVAIVALLYRREFHSEVLRLLAQALPVRCHRFSHCRRHQQQ